MKESLLDLQHQLQAKGAELLVMRGSWGEIVSDVIDHYQANVLYTDLPKDFSESQRLKRLRAAKSELQYSVQSNTHLFEQADLPFKLELLPDSFSKFRRIVEDLSVPADIEPLTVIHSLPIHASLAQQLQNLDSNAAKTNSPFIGGRQAGLAHLETYMSGELPASYEQTRNEFDRWDASTKFSPWLAQGCLSAREIWHAVGRYRRDVVDNKSSYWIQFELLWREYFHWYALKHAELLFEPGGVQTQKRLLSFYPGRFQAWCNGNTIYPLVNACMRQLNQTGYMSNRGRQIVASCFVHELGLDWRYGAAYFQQQLLDYDVGSNWGNWQYLAGVGADPRGWRQFNLEKQQQKYDPDGEFTLRWGGAQVNSVQDSVDMVDWPMD